MTNIRSLRPNTIDPTGARSFPSVSLETRTLVELLRVKSEGTTVTYGEMENALGQSVKPNTFGYRYLTSAKHILLRDYSMVVDGEPKVGVRICTNDEKVLVSGRDLKRARRAVKRSGQKLRSVEYERLTGDQKREWNARMSVVGALELLSAPKAVEVVQRAVADYALPSAKTLELFRG